MYFRIMLLLGFFPPNTLKSKVYECIIPEYFWVYDFSFKLARMLFVNDTNYIFLALMLKHVAIAAKNIYKIEDRINYKIYDCTQNLLMTCSYEMDFEHYWYQCCLFIKFLFFLGYRLTALVNRKNLTNLVTRFRIRIHRFLAMSLRATRTLHKATITTVLNMYLIFLKLQIDNNLI